MKYAAALSLGLAPIALAKAVHNVYPVRRDTSAVERRDGHLRNAGSKVGGGGVNLGAAASAQVIDAALLAQLGLTSGTDIVILWFNQGGGAATTSVTVTQTVTAGAGAETGGAAAPPPPPPAAATTTGAANGGAVAPTPVQGGAGATHTVTVGGKGLAFEPASVKAAVGDQVIFTFMNANHTVTQSTFDLPCKLLEGGMDSGFQPNPNNTVNPPPQVAMQVMVDTPLWFYCRQKGHCGKGMTFSINPTAEKSQAIFQSLAISQNGTGTPSAITGGQAPPAAAPPAAAAPAPEGSAGSSSLAPIGGTVGTSTLASLPGAETGAANGAGTGTGTGVTPGTGQLQGDGSCRCVVQCAFGAFPAVQQQGVGAFGGQAGAIPANMVGLK